MPGHYNFYHNPSILPNSVSVITVLSFFVVDYMSLNNTQSTLSSYAQMKKLENPNLIIQKQSTAM